MKRISLIILAVAAVLVGSSCSKVDDTTQNPLSLMSMSIIPDYSNGSIKCYPEPFGMSEDGLLSFKVEILPLQYLGQFGIDDKYIYKASFRKVVTKSESDSYDFTLDGTVQKYEGDDFLTASFVLKPDVMAKIKANDYMVSFIIGDAAAAQSVSTAFVPLSSNRSTGKDFPDDLDPMLQLMLRRIASGTQQYFNFWNIPHIGANALSPSTYCMQGIEWMRGLQGNDICIGRNSDINTLWGKGFYENTFEFGNSNEITNKAHWYLGYTIVDKANFILGYMTEEMAENYAEFAAARAGALMVRAFGYMCLMEEYTPAIGSEGFDPKSELTGLPMYDTYSPKQTPKGRSTAEYCWNFIKKDLAEAAALAEDSIGFTFGRTNCEDLDAGVAYFLLARACILTQDWDGAINACNKIIAQVGEGKYGFIKPENWGGHNTGADMTGANIEVLPETNAFTCINVNPECILGFASNSLYNGFTEAAGIAAWKTRLANPFGNCGSSACPRIDDRLYNKIPDNDCRKQAWLNAEEIVDFPFLGQTKGIVASRAAFKFAATYGLKDDGNGHTTKDAAVGQNDFTKFRLAEVYLMKAEAEAQKGQSPDATLNTLLAHRGTSLSCNDFSGVSGLALVQLQYRIEMWGEGGREYYNNRRWGISVNRSDSNIHHAKNVTIAPSDMICKIIEEEFQNNPYLNTPSND